MVVGIDPKALDIYVRGVRSKYESELRRWVEIPSISLAPEHRPDIARGAEAAAKAVVRLGGSAEILKTRGNPVVVGRFVGCSWDGLLV